MNGLKVYAAGVRYRRCEKNPYRRIDAHCEGKTEKKNLVRMARAHTHIARWKKRWKI